jgi:hypothetical protein
MPPGTGSPLVGLQSDVEQLRSNNIDLSSLLPPSTTSNPKITDETEDSLRLSHEYVKFARVAQTLQNIDEAVNGYSINSVLIGWTLICNYFSYSGRSRGIQSGCA